MAHIEKVYSVPGVAAYYRLLDRKRWRELHRVAGTARLDAGATLYETNSYPRLRIAQLSQIFHAASCRL